MEGIIWLLVLALIVWASVKVFSVPDTKRDIRPPSWEQDHRDSWDDTDRHVAVDEGLRLSRIFTSMSDEDREEWAVSAQLHESYRLAAPTCIAPWDEDRSWGDCVPGKHPEGKCVEVEIRRKDGSTPTRELGVMFSIAYELDRKQGWMSICTLLDQHGVGASAP